MSYLKIKPQRVSLRKNFSWVFVGRGVYAVTQWGILIVLAKLGTPEVVGQFGLALAVTAPIFALSNFNLRELMSSDINDKYSFSTYLGLRLVSIFVSIVLISSVIYKVGYSLDVAILIFWVGIAKSIENISDVLFGLFQKHEQMIYIANSIMLKGGFSLLCVSIVYYLTHSLILAVCSMCVVWGSVMYFFDLKNATRLFFYKQTLKPNFHLATLGTLGWHAIPLGISTFVVSLNTNIPRYLLERYHSEEVLGYFTGLVYFIAAGDIIFTALRQASIPRLSLFYKENRPAFYKLLLQLITLSAFLGGGGVLIAQFFGKPLLLFFYSAEYTKYSNIFVWLMIIGALRYMFGFISTALIVMRLLQMQMFFLSVTTVVGLVVAWVFIPVYGQMGAVWSMLIVVCLNLIFGILAVIFYQRWHDVWSMKSGKG